MNQFVSTYDTSISIKCTPNTCLLSDITQPEKGGEELTKTNVDTKNVPSYGSNATEFPPSIGVHIATPSQQNLLSVNSSPALSVCLSALCQWTGVGSQSI